MSSLVDTVQTKATATVARLEQWLRSMRGPRGYGGPISHWWESCLLYCGPMADWRYEGVICGYINLYRATKQACWLDQAVQSAGDLLDAQLPAGTFRNSAFQQGPMEGGTPHEAAVDVGLLELAMALREQGAAEWRTYFAAAQRNINSYLLGRLWNEQGFLDQPWNTTLVPNKNATTIEALALYEALSGQDMGRYLHKAADVILAAQVSAGPRAGATIHQGTGRHQLAIGIYTARSACGLLRLYERDHRDQWLEAAARAIPFIRTLFAPDGTFFGRYPDGAAIANPRIIAGAGDILRVLAWGRRYGIAADADIDVIVTLLARAQLPSGGIPTGIGLAWRGARKVYRGQPEFRDVLPVVGWCDKAFRALAMLAAPPNGVIEKIEPHQMGETAIECLWKGRRALFQETATAMRLIDARRNTTIYDWSKGECHPRIYHL